MVSDEDIPGAKAHLAKHLNARKLAEDWRSWYDGDDPVVKSVIMEALYYLGIRADADEGEEELRQAVQKVPECRVSARDNRRGVLRRGDSPPADKLF